MIIPNQWLTRADWLRPVLTVVWMPDRAYLALWQAHSDRSRYIAGQIQLDSSRCSASGYLGALHALSGKTSLRLLQTRWILPMEFLTSGRIYGDQVDNDDLLLPDWIKNCWEDLPAQALPDSIIDGFRNLGASLLGWEPFRNPGTGLRICMGDRNVFFGYNPKGTYIRVSRLVGTGIDRDWIQQTRLLYRQRTGYELETLFVADAKSCGDVLATDPDDIRLIHNRIPPDWNPLAETTDEIFHKTGLKTNSLTGSLPVPRAILRRRTQQTWSVRFRTACIIMLFGWALSFVGACNHSEQSTGSNVDPDGLAWKAEKRLWESRNQEWLNRKANIQSREQVYRTLGLVAGSLPDELVLQRIHIRDTNSAKSGGLRLDIGGKCLGGDPSDTMRLWLEQSRHEGLLTEVENLRFTKEEESLVFSLQGSRNLEGN